MLSKAERKFAEKLAEGIENGGVSPDYARVLKARIRKKLERAKTDINLIKKAGIE